VRCGEERKKDAGFELIYYFCLSERVDVSEIGVADIVGK
jgi:hypothetical protein